MKRPQDGWYQAIFNRPSFHDAIASEANAPQCQPCVLLIDWSMRRGSREFIIQWPWQIRLLRKEESMLESQCGWSGQGCIWWVYLIEMKLWDQRPVCGPHFHHHPGQCLHSSGWFVLGTFQTQVSWSLWWPQHLPRLQKGTRSMPSYPLAFFLLNCKAEGGDSLSLHSCQGRHCDCYAGHKGGKLGFSNRLSLPSWVTSFQMLTSWCK